MATIASTLIDKLGGTTAVHRLTDVPVSTVHSWRKNGIPASRLSHLKLAARAAEIDVDIDALLASAQTQPTQAAA